MTSLATDSQTAVAEEAGRSWRGRLLRATLVVAALAGLFLAYNAMSRTQPTNADGASTALQAWDVLHGNVLLGGWTADITFYPNELLVLAVAEKLHGFDADVVHLCAAFEYTMIAFLVALLARGRSRGRGALVRVGLALAVMLVPVHGIGISVLLLSPDHAGSALLLLLPLLVIDRALTGGQRTAWLPFAVAALLAVGQISDPLVLYIGALPLVAVCGLRVLRTRRWWGRDAQLVVGGLVSVVVSQAALWAMVTVGGLHIQAVPTTLASASLLGRNLRIAVECLAADFGAYLPDRHGPLDVVAGVVHVGLLLLTLGVVVVAAVRLLRRSSTSDLVDELLTVAILVNLGAFVVSTIPADLGSARQIAPVFFLGAALVGRVFGPVVTRALAGVPWRAAVAGLLALVVAGEFAVQAASPAVPHENADVAAFLVRRHLTYGLGNFWAANNITLQTGGAVHVVPVWGDRGVYAFRWLSKPDWYDPARHDARFVVIQTKYPAYGTEAGTVAQFGQPAERARISDTELVYVYDHNLLVGLPAWCPGIAASMADCA